MLGVLTPVYSSTFCCLIFIPPVHLVSTPQISTLAMCAKDLRLTLNLQVLLDSVFTLPYLLADPKLLITLSFLAYLSSTAH